MATHKSPVSDQTLTELVDDLLAKPKMRVALIEADMARESAKLMREARQRRGISQATIATALGVSQARISQVESGRIEDIPSLEFLARFLNECGEGLVLTTTASPANTQPQSGRASVAKQDRLRPTAAPDAPRPMALDSPFARLKALKAQIAKEDD